MTPREERQAEALAEIYGELDDVTISDAAMQTAIRERAGRYSTAARVRALRIERDEARKYQDDAALYVVAAFHQKLDAVGAPGDRSDTVAGRITALAKQRDDAVRACDRMQEARDDAFRERDNAFREMDRRDDARARDDRTLSAALAALDKVVKADRALSRAYDEAEALLRAESTP